MDPSPVVQDEMIKPMRYPEWAGKISTRSMRFHHLVCPPPSLKSGYKLGKTGRERYPRPELDDQWWTILDEASATVLLTVSVREYETVRGAHDSLRQLLLSVTRGSFDYTPRYRHVGDVYFRDGGTMARDNLFVDAGAAKPECILHEAPVLQSIDHWLLSDWPLAVSDPLAGKLDVTLRCQRASLTVGEPAELVVEVRKQKATLDLLQLPHRIVVEPGMIERKDKGYLFTPSEAGKASVSVSVLGPGKEHGAAKLELDVGARH